MLETKFPVAWARSHALFAKFRDGTYNPSNKLHAFVAKSSMNTPEDVMGSIMKGNDQTNQRMTQA